MNEILFWNTKFEAFVQPLIQVFMYAWGLFIVCVCPPLPVSLCPPFHQESGERDRDWLPENNEMSSPIKTDFNRRAVRRQVFLAPPRSFLCLSSVYCMLYVLALNEGT